MPISRIAPNHRSLFIALWLLLLAAISACYFPGLSGGFVFDDEVNILQNLNLRLNSLDLVQLRLAALSGDAGPLGRPLALISFALNLYGGNTDPFYFKLVNLLIHLCNTALVGLFAQLICRHLQDNSRKILGAESALWPGFTAAACWGLHPLNLTSVLYVVQRMTSMSALFGLLALVIYTDWRLKNSKVAAMPPKSFGVAVRALLILVCLSASVLSKESGLLFLPLIFWTEYNIFRFRMDDRIVRIGKLRLQSLVSGLIVLALIYVALFVMPNMLRAGAFANRDFTLTERGLTESRVLFYYLRLVVLPRSTELSLYHDDFQLSKGIWEPATTALSILALAVGSAVSYAFRRRWPLVLFGWGWFLISHALESTVFPLELVHEHRNYFATIGFFICIAWGLQQVQQRWRRIASVCIFGYLALLASTTFTRSMQWSNNVDLALLEASNHPESARANYELGKVYLALLERTGDKRFGVLSGNSFAVAANSFAPGVGPLFGSLHLAYYLNESPDHIIFGRLLDKLENDPFYNGNTSFLNSFMLCQVEQRCRMPDADAIRLFEATLDNPRGPPQKRAEVYKILAQYYINRRKDLEKGIELIDAASATFDSAATRIMYAQAFRLQGRFDDASKQLARAVELDSSKIYQARIERERQAILSAAAP